MSYHYNAVFLYGVHISDEYTKYVRSDTLERINYSPDCCGLYDICEAVFGNKLDIYYGMGSSVYIGFKAILPYNQPKYTKDEMDQIIHSCLVELFDIKKAKTFKPNEIFEAWGDY